jgi:hypothetical protein
LANVGKVSFEVLLNAAYQGNNSMAEKTMAAFWAAIACEALYHIPANSHSR